MGCMLTTCSDAMRFCERLRSLREKAGITQRELADRANLPVGSVRNHEQGQRLPSWGAVVKLARALGVKTDDFANCDEVSGGAMEAKSPKRGRKPKAEGKPAAKRKRGKA
jgi:transcriptional regulator with XRE-family HTH domain